MSPQYWPPPAALHELRTQLGPPPHKPLAVSHTQPGLNAEHVSPQSTVAPQPSPTLPQYLALGSPSHTSLVQPDPPMQELVAALQTHPGFRLAQLSPQSIPRPQPSPTFPQYRAPATGAQLAGAQTLALPTQMLLSHTQPGVSVAQLSPQASPWPHPSEMLPQYDPMVVPDVNVH
jgi:hypothetical protein